MSLTVWFEKTFSVFTLFLVLKILYKNSENNFLFFSFFHFLLPFFPV